MGSNVIPLMTGGAGCAHCRGGKGCLVNRLDLAERAELSKYTMCTVPVRRGQHLVRQGEPLQSLYLIRTGSVKAYLDSEDGCEQTIGFHFPGDLVGVDAIANGHFPVSVMALESTAYCMIPYEKAQQLACKLPQLWQQIIRFAASDLIENQNHALLLGQKTAPARLASFLLQLSNRFAARGCSRTEFNLSMSRQEIANYLAVAVETISRLFTDFQRRNIIAIDRRLIKILSSSALEEATHDSRLIGMRTFGRGEKLIA